MNREEYDESKWKCYQAVSKARHEIERIQFGEGLWNPVTNAIKEELIGLENDIQNNRIKVKSPEQDPFIDDGFDR